MPYLPLRGEVVAAPREAPALLDVAESHAGLHYRENRVATPAVSMFWSAPSTVQFGSAPSPPRRLGWSTSLRLAAVAWAGARIFS
jgi:hypothetical protein